MTRMRTQYALIAVVAMLALFAGCKGESPTQPSNNPTTPPGGTVTPATGVAITLSVTNSQPQVDSTSVITANVTQNGSAVPNGTAVEFTTSLGSFTEANAQTMIRTTTNGVATATLTSSTAGTATVTATVANVAKTTTVTFNLKPVVTPPPNTAPVISSISPTTGRPQGGEILTISGSNFSAPKVIFDFGGGKTVEAQIVSATPTTIQVLTPSVDLGTGQQKTATVVLLNNAGTPNEVRVTATTPFTFQAEVLTPKINAVSPASGPIDGGTRVTIFGEGFQAPVQVFFGSAEASLADAVTFSQLKVIAPAASLTNPTGSGAVLGPVAIKVVNINSATNVTAADAFRYIQKMVITAVGPTEGPFTGGTRVEIDGQGFNDPVAVSIGGIAANYISAVGSKVVAITNPVVITGCADVTGPVIVTNVDNGDSATGPIFTYRVPKPAIISATNASAGGSITVTVANAVGFPRLTVGGAGISITSTTQNPDGTTTFTGTVPLNGLTFKTQTCVSGGTAPLPTLFDVVYSSLTTGCTNTLTNGSLITPQAVPVFFSNPTSFTVFTSTVSSAGPPPVTGAPSAPQTLTIVNNGFVDPTTGTGSLIVNSVTQSGCGNFSIAFPSTPVTLGSCDPFPITAQYNRTSSAGSDSCTLTLNTNAGTRSLTLVGTAH